MIAHILLPHLAGIAIPDSLAHMLEPHVRDGTIEVGSCGCEAQAQNVNLLNKLFGLS